MRLKALACCSWLLAFAVVCSAQGDKSKPRPDFSGSWVLDASKSESVTSGVSETLTVTMKDAEFHLHRKTMLNGKSRVVDLLYYTDGRGENNSGILGVSEVKSKTEWQGSKIISKAAVDYPMPNGPPVNFDVVETWELSGDGQVFTDTMTASASMGTRTVKYVYNRAP